MPAWFIVGLHASKKFRLPFAAATLLCVLCSIHGLSFAEQEIKNSPVTLDGRAVIEIGFGRGSFTPDVRAKFVSDRLKKVADDPRLPATVTLVPSNDSVIDLMAGDEHLVSVFSGDAAIAGMTPDALAQQWARSLQSAINDYRQQRSWGRRILRLLMAILLVACTIALLVLIRKASVRSAQSVSARLHQRMDSIRSPIVTVVPRERLRTGVQLFFTSIRFVLYAAVIGGAFHLLLYIHPATRAAASTLFDSLLGSISGFGAEAWRNAPSMLFLIVVAVITWYLLKAIRFVFARIADGSLSIEGFRPTWAETTQRLVSMLLIVLAVLISYPYIPGSRSAAFQGISIFLGLLLSLGSTGLVANLVTGIMLTYMDAFRPGDLIKVGEFMGRVQRVSMLTTQLQTRKNEIVTIPNSLMLAHEVTNLSCLGEKKLIITSSIGVGYDVPWQQVESLMKLGASRTPGVNRSVESFVYTLSLNQFDITHEVNVFLEEGASYWETRSELNRNVLNAFNEYGVQIMTPAYEGDPEQAKVVPQDRWFSAPASPNQHQAMKTPPQIFKKTG
jgi:small-conductance mechanosensitive channel